MAGQRRPPWHAHSLQWRLVVGLFVRPGVRCFVRRLVVLFLRRLCAWSGILGPGRLRMSRI